MSKQYIHGTVGVYSVCTPEDMITKRSTSAYLIISLYQKNDRDDLTNQNQ